MIPAVGSANVKRNAIEDELPKDFANSLKKIGYVFDEKLGQGSYASVYRCHIVDTKGAVVSDYMAVKHINLSKEYKPKYREPKSIAELELIEEKSRRVEQWINTSVWRRFKARFGFGSRKHFKIEETPDIKVKLTNEQIKCELNALNRTKHQNVVEMHNEITYEDSRFGSRNPNPIHLLIFLDLAKDDLFHYKFRYKSTVTVDEAKEYSAQIIRGLSHLHSHGIAHLDLKSENILVFVNDPNNPYDITLKIADFGLALLYPIDGSDDLPNPSTFRCGTYNYADPLLIRTRFQIIQKPDTDVSDIDFFKADVWSYGCIVLLFFIDLLRFYRIFETNYNSVKTDPNFKLGDIYISELRSKKASQDVISFLSDIFLCDQTNRKSAIECGEHVWIKDELVGLKKRSPSLKHLQKTSQ